VGKTQCAHRDILIYLFVGTQALPTLPCLDAKDIGKIDVNDFHTYVAIERTQVNKALAGLQNGKIKGKNFRARKLS
jgi:hypothetical protein